MPEHLQKEETITQDSTLQQKTVSLHKVTARQIKN